MITFSIPNKKPNFCVIAPTLAVLLDGKIVGNIYPANLKGRAAYQYFPKGSKEGGAVFTSLQDCKRSLIEETS